MPFTWPVDRHGLPALPENTAPDYDRKVAEQNAAVNLAITVLHALSGRQFGLLEQTARPCPTPLPTLWGDRWGQRGIPVYAGGQWSTGMCGCVGRCQHSGPNMVHLPGPVHSVDEVKINGVVLPANVWVAEGNVLYRRDAPWPDQNLNRPLGDVGTWGVTYQRGIPAPDYVGELTGELAKQFLIAINDDASRCRLPRTVTTVNRQGITYRAYDPAVIYANGKTGLAEVDMWLAAINPHALMSSPSVI